MKRALVTGSSRGIGAGIARALAADGWELIINYRESEEKANALAAELGGRAIRADVSDTKAVERMFSEAGELELLVNNAGISRYGLLQDISDEDWSRVFAVNVNGARNCCKAVIPQMVRRRSGCIINISSVWGRLGASCEVTYSATKAALISMTQSLAKELGPSGIRVNCVAPGVIDTDMLSFFSGEDKAQMAEQSLLGRIGTPEDVAHLAAFLASDRASFITGQTIGVDGGFPL